MTGPTQITEQEGLEAALGAKRFLLFKHSRICPTSARAFSEYSDFVLDHPEVPTGWIDVIAKRPWSLRVAEETGVAHQSPQVLLLVGGKAVWTASHGGIRGDALRDALAGLA